MSESTLICSGSKLTREELALVPTPAGTTTHKPIPHVEVINALTETLGFRQIARLTIYRAFIEAELEAPRHLDRKVHELYFNPTVQEFQPRTLWSLSNAFTSAFKELEPIPQFKATAKLAGFLERP